jgi:ABC-type branched-subunit amino acid transport system substrate-binding protein
MHRILTGILAALAVMTTSAMAQDKPIKIGLLVTQEGVFTVPGNDVIRLFRMALAEHKNQVAGKKIEWVLGPSDATPDTAVRQARKLFEQDQVDIIVGPLSGSEGIALRDYAKTVPNKTIINGTSAALETTWVTPAPNFFRFNTDGSQWGYGLGKYVVEKKGWKKIATVAADYSFGYTNFLGFALDFCNAGGQIVARHWTPLGNADFGSVIAALPDDVDAIYLGLGATDALNFLNQYQQAGGKAKFIGGSILADQSVLAAKGRAKEMLVGTPMSGSQADDWDDAAWQAFVKRYRDAYPASERFPSPSLYATNYYNATNAVLKALDAVKGNLDDNQASFRKALSEVVLDAPNGRIRLDQNRQAIGPTFITEVAENAKGELYNKFVGKVDNVTQTLGMTPEQFRAVGLPGRNTPACK